ncbi:histidine kinase [Nocardioides convexus]|uniref:histidine kinase n=1 Tax=Nocardioides convexus TaxID=2712224 RepID=UPI002418A1C7|nr:histidine kinase [Nocardioides convexus]
MHDGVAQDIASLGYLVDALAARPADEQQAKTFAMLRERVSVVVSEVRRSVMNLRTSIGEAESLGGAISSVARHLSESSGIPIRVRLDEQPARLRPEVEAEPVPDRPGGDEQRRQARPGHLDRRTVPGLCTRGDHHGHRRRRRPAGRPQRLPRAQDHARTCETCRRGARGPGQRQPRAHRLGVPQGSPPCRRGAPGGDDIGGDEMSDSISVLLIDDHEFDPQRARGGAGPRAGPRGRRDRGLGRRGDREPSTMSPRTSSSPTCRCRTGQVSTSSARCARRATRSA